MLPQDGSVIARQRPTESPFDAPFDEMFELPGKQPFVEDLLEREAGLVTPPGALGLQQHQLVDGAFIELEHACLRLPLHGVPQRRVADIFQQEHAAV